MENSNVRKITRTAVLIALTIAFQSLGMQQMITGPVVNMFLFLGVMLIGMWGGVITGLITPLMALWVGIIKPVMAPMAPAIALSNAALCVVFGFADMLGSHRSIVARAVGAVIASVVKFLILAGTVRFLVQLPPKAAQAMQGLQLVTALSGGVAAIILYEALARTGAISGLGGNPTNRRR
ncbi:MAG: ECF transporter S component [Clostridia bacterium]|nr:ECF transporter S component [Clostridia bacterium]